MIVLTLSQKREKLLNICTCPCWSTCMVET